MAASRLSRSSRSEGLDTSALLSRAERAQRAGDLSQAIGHYDAVLHRFPANPRARQALRDMGPDAVRQLVATAQAAATDGRMNDAELAWAGAVVLAPEHADLGLSLVECRLTLGRSHAALDAVEQVLEHHPDHARARDTKGRVLRDLGRVDEAAACHRAALGHGQADAAPLNHLGILAQARGDRAAAADLFRQALRLRPEDPDLHYNLSRSLDYRADDPHLAQMQALLARGRPDDPSLAALHFALFNALDARDDRSAAFAHLQTANRLRRQALGYDLRRDARRLAFARALVASRSGPVATAGQAAPRPIFIVGLPRSGTTLVERILAQAPGVQGAGELSVVANAVATVMRRAQSENRLSLTATDLAGLRADLLQGLRAHSDGAPVLIDKMPLNFRWTGFICAALPEARIVHLTRDPVAVAWSLFRHSFAGRGNGFAYDMADIAGYILLERQIMQDWRALFGPQIHALGYGDLVGDTETASRALVAACGLDWSDGCLTPHLSRDSVLTASAGQVRRPIYDGSDAAWQRYAVQLGPLVGALRQAVPDSAALTQQIAPTTT